MMKRTTIWLLIALLTFGFGVRATLFFLKFNTTFTQKTEGITNASFFEETKEFVDLPTPSICELSTNPQKYDGKIIRLSSTLAFEIEGLWFYDPFCTTSKGATQFYSEDEDVWTSISKAREREKSKYPANELNLTIVGKFKIEDTKKGYVSVPFQIEILKVAKATHAN